MTSSNVFSAWHISQVVQGALNVSFIMYGVFGLLSGKLSSIPDIIIVNINIPKPWVAKHGESDPFFEDLL
jgi:hypothetical protein